MVRNTVLMKEICSSVRIQYLKKKSTQKKWIKLILLNERDSKSPGITLRNSKWKCWITKPAPNMPPMYACLSSKPLCTIALMNGEPWKRRCSLGWLWFSSETSFRLCKYFSSNFLFRIFWTLWAKATKFVRVNILCKRE